MNPQPNNFQKKIRLIENRLNEIRNRDPDTASNINLTDFAKACLKTEDDCDRLISFLEKHPQIRRADVTCFLFDLS